MSWKPTEKSACVKRDQSPVSNDAERSLKIRPEN